MFLVTSVSLARKKPCSSIVEMHAATKANGVRGASGCLSLQTLAVNMFGIRMSTGSVHDAVSTRRRKAT